MSRLTDYGIVLLARLARDGGRELHNARELAAQSGLPLPVVSKLLKTLTREGFLVSQRGARGGYTLARRPDEISVNEVIYALEGPIGLTECGAHPGQCQQEASCQVRNPWQRINRVIREALEQVRLSELVESGEPPLIPPESLLGGTSGLGASAATEGR